GTRRLRIISISFMVVVGLGLGAVIYGLMRAGELDADKWSIFANEEIWRFLGVGLWNTIRVAAVDGLVAMSIGVLIAAGQLSRLRAIRFASIGYAELFRSLPTLLMILFCYFGLPILGLTVSPFWAIVIGSGLYNSAVLSNIFRGGIATLDAGQYEAGYSLGATKRLVMSYIIWPQAIRRMMAAILSQCVVLFKDSSLGFFIGYEEVLKRSQVIGTFTSDFMQPYIVGGCIYIVIIFLLRRLALRLYA